MRTSKLLVLAPFALAIACGGTKAAPEPTVPSTDTLADAAADLDKGPAIPDAASTAIPTTNVVDAGAVATAAPVLDTPPAVPVDAGAADAGKKPGKGGKPAGAGGHKPKAPAKP